MLSWKSSSDDVEGVKNVVLLCKDEKCSGAKEARELGRG
jgi:hypothetical protein